MAKADFCFTYYDGDAARDKAHMNRLERGAYDDIISAQRKFGHLTLSLIKKILSSDFPTCWEALEIILKKDAEGKFFIEWLEVSIQKALQHSKKQADNAKKRWEEENAKKQNGNATAMPLEDGDEDGYESVFVVGKKDGAKKPKQQRQITELIHPFDSPAWLQAWDGWIAYRKEIGKPYKSFRGTQSQLKWFSDNEFTVGESIGIIQESIRNQYQGLFKPKANGSTQSTTGGAKRPKGFHTDEELRAAALRVVSGN